MLQLRLRLAYAPLARFTLALSLTASSLAILPPRAARAQAQPAPEAIEKAKGHFAKGKELYDRGDKIAAVDEFKEAFKLSRNPLLLYNVGFVYDELGDRALAIHYYQKFLTDAPDNEKSAGNRALASERLKVLKKELAAEEAAIEAGASRPADPPRSKKPESAVKEFTHTIVEEAPPGKPIDLIAVIPDDADWRLTLYYRGAGEDDFSAVKMKPRYTEMVGRIPAEAVTGSSVQYYIEAKNAEGKLVGFSGRAASPNIVYLDEGARPHYYADPSEGGSGELATGDEEPVAGGATATGDRTRPLTWAKWGATGSAVAFVGTSLVFYVLAAQNGTELEAQAFTSTNPGGGICSNGRIPPCNQFSAYQQGLERQGKRLETYTNVTLGLGVASAAAAGVLWYLDLRSEKAAAAAGPAEQARRGVRLLGTPVVTEDFLGGAAVLEF